MQQGIYCQTGNELSFLKTVGGNLKRMSSNIHSGKESELVAAIVAGDTQLYYRLISPYERSVYIMSLLCMRNQKDAEEVAQETFIRAFRDLRAFQGDSKFSVWLFSIALNEANSRLPRQATRTTPLDQPHSEEMLASPALLHEWQELNSDVVERKEIRNLLLQAVGMLSDIHQQVFFLCDVEGLNVNDTAKILNINTSLVKVTHQRARMMLQRLLAPQLKVIDGASKEGAVPVGRNGNTLGTSALHRGSTLNVRSEI